MVALTLHHYATYPELQGWQDEHAERVQTGRLSPSDLAQLEGVALFLHEDEGILGKEGDLGEIRVGRASAQLQNDISLVMNRRLREIKAYTVNCALCPVHKMNFIELAAPTVTCEDD